MSKIVIDRELCIGCGKCADDCVAKHILMTDGIPETVGRPCIECGHCYAICPVKAVTMEGYSEEGLDQYLSPTEIDSDKLLLAMKSRRTVRRFKDMPVSEEDVLKLLEAGRYCPTGSNSQNVNFIILKDTKAKCEELAVDLFRKSQKLAGTMYSSLKDRPIPDNFFFMGAPLVILTSAKRDVDAALASSYMELLAASMGLGVVYSGFFTFAANHCKGIKKLIELPEGHNIVSCLVIGHPDVEYQRIVPRKALNLSIK